MLLDSSLNMSRSSAIEDHMPTLLSIKENPTSTKLRYGHDAVEDGDGVGKDEADDPKYRESGDPARPGFESVGRDLALGFDGLHHFDVNVFGANVTTR